MSNTYTMLDAASLKGVCKSSIYYKVKKLKLGRVMTNGVILLNKKELDMLFFRAKNKKRYIKNLQSKL